MFPPVKIVSAGLEIREFGPPDAAQVTAFVAADDRTALPPGSPGFLALVAPLNVGLLTLYLAVAAAAWRAGIAWWRTIPAGALLVARPVATVLPIT